MADLEDVTLDGRPLQSLRVADLKAALEERGLSKSGQKNALVKRLKGALMLENLQRTSTAHIGLQPNSQIGEEMSQNSFIKQYLAKQQELLRQRLEREAREAYETNEQEDHSQVNNSTSCPPQAQQDAPGVLDEQHKPPGPSGGEELFDLENTREGNQDQEADLSLPPASGSVAMHGPGEHRPERCSASSEVTADSDDEDGEEDGDKDDWDSGARRGLQQPARVPTIRDRSGASCQPQQQHIPSLLSPQLRQPTPPPSPPPELSFPLPDTPKQSPPSPDVAPARRSSSSGSSSSDSCSSSPEPQRSGHAERKPGPLTLLARKMESEGAFSGAGWHVGDGEGDRQETSSPSTTLFTARGPLEGLVSAITHTASTISHLPMVPGNTQGVTGGHSAHIQIPMSVLKATAKNERDCELEREKAPELERQDPAEEVAWERILVLAGEESQKALGKEGIEQPHASEQEKLSKSRERQLAQEQERELALAKEREAQEQRLAQERALELERQKELEKQKALELEREKELERQQDLEKQVVLEQERLKREREEMEKERAKALEMERALEQDRIDRERALEAERKEKERIEREKQEMLEMERLERKKEREKALEQARLEKEIAFEQETIEREKALKQERLAIEKGEMGLTEARTKMVQDMVRWEVKDMEERKAVLEQERMERERAENERKEHLEWEKAKEHENLERHEPLEKEQKEKEKEEERKLSIERRVEKEKVKQKEEQETEAEKERESHPPFKHGHELCPIPLPTPTLLSTGKARKPLAEAGEQNDAPVSRNEAESSAHMSPTPLSPQPSFKRSMFLRDSPIPPQSSSTSVVIKRPCAFSDTPQPQASPDLSLISFGEAQQERHQPSIKKEDPQMCRKDEFAAVAESVEIQSEKKDAVGTAFGQTTKEEGSTDVDLAKAEHGNESIKTTKEVDESRERGDAKKEVKQRRQRSQSTDSSSESDSGSPSSQSSRSSTSSQENTTFRSRGEEKLKSDPSPWHSVTVEPQIKASEETSRASPRTRVTSAENSSRAADGNSPTKKPSIVDFPSEPTREEIQRKRKHSEEEEEKDKQRQVNETTMAQAEKSSETSEETPKVFSPRKISLSSTKSSPGTGSAESEQDSGAAGGRKRRWGSSTAVTAKKPSISITTDSLKSLIPDIRPPLGQEAVVDLHPEEAVLSEAEDEEPERTDQDLQIRRTVTQVVHPERQENGQKEAKRSRHEELEDEDTERTKVHEEKMGASFPGAVETQSHTSHDAEINTVTPSDTLIRRSISQQKTGVSITIDDPVRTSRQPSPPRGKVSNIVHICNLVRPFTLGQLKELLSRTGALVEEGFWIDRIKSHCYVTYSSSEEAVATRAALHGVKWPQSNPKVLCVDFSHQDELDFHKGLGTTDKHGAEEQGLVPGQGRTSGIPSLLPERDQWAEREREMERRERARAEREWDRDKIREFGKVEDKEGGPHRSCSRERRRKERGKSKEKKADKKEKTAEDPPAKLLDDLFRKTKAPPCIYWLPLTEEQYIQRQAARAERIKEREKRRKEQEEEEEKKKEEERQEKMKAGGSSTGDRGEGEKDKDRERGRDRERERERENDKRRDGYRRPGGSGAGGNRRSRSRSAPRERRR